MLFFSFQVPRSNAIQAIWPTPQQVQKINKSSTDAINNQITINRQFMFTSDEDVKKKKEELLQKKEELHQVNVAIKKLKENIEQLVHSLFAVCTYN